MFITRLAMALIDRLLQVYYYVIYIAVIKTVGIEIPTVIGAFAITKCAVCPAK